MPHTAVWRPPIEFLIELFFNVLLDVLIQGLGEFLVEVGLRAIDETRRPLSRRHPVFAGVGLVLLGVISGVIVSLIWPERIVQGNPIPGISLVLSPLANGYLMERYGRWRESRRKRRTYLSTFGGGALFAFTMSLVRFLWVTL